MKNLSNAKADLTVRGVPSEKGERKSFPEKTFRRRPEIQFQTPKYRAKIEWMIEDFDSFHAALLRKFSLGSLPKRAAKYACTDFDLEDEREYCGDDGEAVTGGMLAGVTAYIVRCARDPIDYLFSLKNVPAAVIEPIKTYLRVKLAMGRLAAEIEGAKAALQRSNLTVISAFAQQSSKTSSEKTNVESSLRLTSLSKTQSKAPLFYHRPCADEVPHQVRDDSVKVLSPPKPAPAFKYHTSPAKTYGFKEMTAQYGYDPRDTSVYWIEKRANALRRKWKKYGKRQRGEVTPCARETPPELITVAHEGHEASAPLTKYFVPADADYNSVWPPVEMPSAPPKITPKSRSEESETAPIPTPAPGHARPKRDLTCMPFGFNFKPVTYDINTTNRGATMSVKTLLLSSTIAAASFAVSAPVQASSDPFLGEIMLVGFNFCPRNTAAAEGQLLPISSNAALFSLYGTMYGGDGRTTFGLPDLRGRTIIGEGRGPGLSPRSVGEKSGSEKITASSETAAKGEEVSAAHKDHLGSNMQPSLVMKYCVATQGIYPSRN